MNDASIGTEHERDACGLPQAEASGFWEAVPSFIKK